MHSHVVHWKRAWLLRPDKAIVPAPTCDVIGTPAHKRPYKHVVLVTIVTFLTQVSWIVTPYLYFRAPFVLAMLAPRILNLQASIGTVPIWLFMLGGICRLGLTDVSFYCMGKAHHTWSDTTIPTNQLLARALRVKRRFGSWFKQRLLYRCGRWALGPIRSWAHRHSVWIDRNMVLIIAFWPKRELLYMAGQRKIHPLKVACADVCNSIVYLLLFIRGAALYDTLAAQVVRLF